VSNLTQNLTVFHGILKVLRISAVYNSVNTYAQRR